MQIIVCSDNHGIKEVLPKLKENYPEASAFIHCGDMEMTQEEMEGFAVVTGNNDYLDRFPLQIIVEVQGLRIFVTHGHLLPYGMRTQALAKLAIENNCTMACYGHTHIFNEEMVEGVFCLNPGSLNYNRDGSLPSYAIVEYEDGNFNVTKAYVKDLK